MSKMFVLNASRFFPLELDVLFAMDSMLCEALPRGVGPRPLNMSISGFTIQFLTITVSVPWYSEQINSKCICFVSKGLGKWPSMNNQAVSPSMHMILTTDYWRWIYDGWQTNPSACENGKKVGNIPWQCTENDLGNFFSSVGTVTNVRFVYDRETNRPKGFGFCDFADQQGADNAVNQLNGADFNGRALRVNYANK